MWMSLRQSPQQGMQPRNEGHPGNLEDQPCRSDSRGPVQCWVLGLCNGV